MHPQHPLAAGVIRPLAISIAVLAVLAVPVSGQTATPDASSLARWTAGIAQGEHDGEGSILSTIARTIDSPPSVRVVGEVELSGSFTVDSGIVGQAAARSPGSSGSYVGLGAKLTAPGLVRVEGGAAVVGRAVRYSGRAVLELGPLVFSAAVASGASTDAIVAPLAQFAVALNAG